MLSCNLALLIYAVVREPLFSYFLLAAVIVNLLGYFVFYLAMKMIWRERVGYAVCAMGLLSIICWLPALYLFTRELTNWMLTPAMSRAGNEDCILLDFYDVHDCWHFLSAGGLFFTALTILVVDNDLTRRRLRTIPMF